MANIIACNLGSYRQYRDTAYEHLARIGLTHVEIPCPPPGDAAAVCNTLNAHGLTATTLIVRCQMDTENTVVEFARSLDTVAEMGVHTVFTSVKAGEVDRQVVYGRLRDIGDAAAEKGIVVAMETHPDLITNGDVALETMQSVNHPNIRVNFDTANVHFYNQDVNSVEEVKKIIDYVAAVHLKDTDGGYQSWHFPALGEGIVDFPAIFQVLAEKGFYGPYTMELEGIRGEELTREGAEGRVEKSMAYLRENDLAE